MGVFKSGNIDNNVRQFGSIVLSTGSNVSEIVDDLSGTVTDAQLATALAIKSLITLNTPTGTIQAFGGTSAPTGWFICDGTAVSRTTYSALFAVIAETFGQGDNSTTFNIPDFRGKFLRMVDGATGRDPNAATRIAMNTGGATGDNIGSIQDSEFESHQHTITGGAVGGNYSLETKTSYLGEPLIARNTSNTSLVGGSTETRPINAYVNYIIKY